MKAHEFIEYLMPYTHFPIITDIVNVLLNYRDCVAVAIQRNPLCFIDMFLCMFPSIGWKSFEHPRDEISYNTENNHDYIDTYLSRLRETLGVLHHARGVSSHFVHYADITLTSTLHVSETFKHAEEEVAMLYQ